MEESEITIRVAREDDRHRLQRLAERDSAKVPSGRLLVAERDSQLIAAVAVDAGSAIADPFLPTGPAVELLRVRTRQLRGPQGRGRLLPSRWRLRGDARPIRCS
jgi:hypothetical protein